MAKIQIVQEPRSLRASDRRWADWLDVVMPFQRAVDAVPASRYSVPDLWAPDELFRASVPSFVVNVRDAIYALAQKRDSCATSYWGLFFRARGLGVSALDADADGVWSDYFHSLAESLDPTFVQGIGDRYPNLGLPREASEIYVSQALCEIVVVDTEVPQRFAFAA